MADDIVDELNQIIKWYFDDSGLGASLSFERFKAHLDTTSTIPIDPENLNAILYRYLKRPDLGSTSQDFCDTPEVCTSNFRKKSSLLLYGAFFRVVQKGLHLLEIEANLNDAGDWVENAFIRLDPWDLLTKPADKLKEMVRMRRLEGEEAI